MTSPAVYALVEGTAVEFLGDVCIVFSPLSGETAFLNDEGAAVLEALSEGPADVATLCERFANAAPSPLDHATLTAWLEQGWSALVDGGLIRAGVAMVAGPP